ncbi:MAG: HlyD family efflux transporter periplasmic adaptor subunit [Chloroflexota bacterium]
MKTLKAALAVLLIAGVTVPLASCGSGNTSAALESQVASVIRGNLTSDISAGGNLALSQKEDLVFEVGGTVAGVDVTVAEVLVEEGGSVKKGDVIARLNSAPLEDAVITAERAVKTAELDLKTAQDGEFKIKTAEFDLESATTAFNKLNYPYTYTTFALDVPAAIEALSKAQRQLEEAKAGIEAGPTSEDYGEALADFREAQLNVASALERLARGQSIDTYSSENISKIVSDYTAARTAQINMEKARYTLEQTKTSVQATLDKAVIALEKAQEDLAEAKEDLANAVITAPFDGFITAVNVEGGDEVQKGTIAAEIADPAKFEAKIMVGESDIFKVKEEGTATIQIDASPMIVLTARVTHISPTATVQSGVVNFEVMVEADATQSLETPTESQQSATGTQSRLSSSSVQAPTQSQGTGTQGATLSQLREGLSVTVNIILAESKDVLMVPNGAVTRSGRNTQVQVMKDGVSETRVVKTGISNWQYTEVTEGLTEGEQVVVPKTTSTTSTQNQQRGFFIPGVGGPR